MTKNNVIRDSAKILEWKEGINSVENSISDFVNQARAKFIEDSVFRERMVDSACLNAALSLEFRNIYGIEAPYFKISSCAIGKDVDEKGNLTVNELIEWEEGNKESIIFDDCQEVINAAAYDLDKNNFYVSTNNIPDDGSVDEKLKAIIRNNDVSDKTLPSNVKLKDLQNFFIDVRAGEDGSPFYAPFLAPGLNRWSGYKMYDRICKIFPNTEGNVYDCLSGNAATINENTFIKNTDGENLTFNQNRRVQLVSDSSGDSRIRYRYEIPDDILYDAKNDDMIFYDLGKVIKREQETGQVYIKNSVNDHYYRLNSSSVDINPGETKYVRFFFSQEDMPSLIMRSLDDVRQYIAKLNTPFFDRLTSKSFCTGIGRVRRSYNDTVGGPVNVSLEIIKKDKDSMMEYIPAETKTRSWSTGWLFWKKNHSEQYTDYHDFYVAFSPITSEDQKFISNSMITNLENSYKEVIREYKKYIKINKGEYDSSLEIDESIKNMQAVIDAKTLEDKKEALFKRLEQIYGNYDPDESIKTSVISNHDISCSPKYHKFLFWSWYTYTYHSNVYISADMFSQGFSERTNLVSLGDNLDMTPEEFYDKLATLSLGNEYVRTVFNILKKNNFRTVQVPDDDHSSNEPSYIDKIIFIPSSGKTINYDDKADWHFNKITMRRCIDPAHGFSNPTNRAYKIDRYLKLHNNIYNEAFKAISCRINKRTGTLRQLCTIVTSMNVAISTLQEKRKAIGNFETELSTYAISDGFGTDEITIKAENWEPASNVFDNMSRMSEVIITGDEGVGYQKNKIVDIDLISNSYELTKDTSAQEGKIYYVCVDGVNYIEAGLVNNDDLIYYYEYNSEYGEYEPTEDTEVVPGKIYYVKLDNGRKYLAINTISTKEEDFKYYYEVYNGGGLIFQIKLLEPISTDIENLNPRIVRVAHLED